MVLQFLHQVTTLDGVDRLGNASPLAEDSPMDIPGLEDFLEFLISSDASVNGELVNCFMILFILLFILRSHLFAFRLRMTFESS